MYFIWFPVRYETANRSVHDGSYHKPNISFCQAAFFKSVTTERELYNRDLMSIAIALSAFIIHQKNKIVVGTRFLSPITVRQSYVLLGDMLLVAACCYDGNDTSENIGVLLRTRHDSNAVRTRQCVMYFTCYKLGCVVRSRHSSNKITPVITLVDIVYKLFCC